MAKTLLLLIIAFVTLEFIVSSVLSWLNTKWMTHPVPPELEGLYDDEKYRKQQDYMRTNKRVSLIARCVSFGLTLVILGYGLLGWLDNQCKSWTDIPVLQVILFLLIYNLFNTIIALPFSYYSTFVIEERFGFNRTTHKTFWLDTLKSFLVSTALSAVLMAVVYWLYQTFGQQFWIWATLVCAVFIIFFSMFYSNLIVPLFNKQTPLPEGELRDAITGALESFGSKFKDIYWFFIPLFCIYLIIPLFASINKERRIKIFTYIIGISLVINFMIPFIIAVLNRYAKINYGWPFKIYVGFEYLYYVLVGYVLHKKELKLSQRLIIYAIGLTGLLMLIFGCLYESKHNPNGSVMLFKGYYNLPIVMYSTGMFLFLKQVGKRIKSEKSIKALTFLQSYTFPIYLIHRYFLDVFEENLHLVHMQKDSLIYVISATVLALALSILTTMLLRKIPVLRRIVP